MIYVVGLEDFSQQLIPPAKVPAIIHTNQYNFPHSINCDVSDSNSNNPVSANSRNQQGDSSDHCCTDEANLMLSKVGNSVSSKIVLLCVFVCISRRQWKFSLWKWGYMHITVA